MTDRIVLAGLRFEARHGVHEDERMTPQPFEVDVELEVDLQAAGAADDLARTIDYAAVYDQVRAVMDGPSRRLLEALATAIADAVLEPSGADAIVVRVRKPAVWLGGPLDHAGVEIRRVRRSA